MLVRWEWPGNIRELENFVERSVILSPGSVLQAPLTELQKAVEEANGGHNVKLRDKERSDLAENMIAEVKEHPKSQPGVRAGALDFRFYAVKRLDAIALVSFDVENTSSEIVDLEDPQINLITAADKTKDSKKPKND